MVGDWLGLSALLVAVLGFAATLWQIRDTKKVIRATGLAIQKTQRYLAASQLIALIPTVLEIERELERAIERDDRGAVMEHLRHWRLSMNEVLAYLSVRGSGYESEVKMLESALVAANTARGSLANTRAKLGMVTAGARGSIADACGALAKLRATFMASMGEEGPEAKQK